MARRAALSWALGATLLVAELCLAGDASLLIDDFEAGLRPGWEAKRFKGETVYTVVPEGSGRVLRAESGGSASGLVFKIAYDPRQYPVLSWRWKVAGVVATGDESRKEGDDYAARVYVVFPHWFPPKTRSINYIWANRLPKGRHVPNPFFANAVMVAVESGPAEVGRWVSERRNVLEDYRVLFGGAPPRAGAIALMTDTDNTGERAVGWYDDLRLEQH